MIPINMKTLRRLSGTALAFMIAGMSADSGAQALRNVEAEQKEADRAAQAPTHPGETPETAQVASEPEQMELPIPWPPSTRRRR